MEGHGCLTVSSLDRDHFAVGNRQRDLAALDPEGVFAE